VQLISNYWSTPEQASFPALLAHFGTNWRAIANWIGSKTHIMVCSIVTHCLEKPSYNIWGGPVANIRNTGQELLPAAD
jgi:hypothetical protein